MKRSYLFFTFFACLIFALVIFLLFRSSSLSLSQQIISPVQTAIIRVTHAGGDSNSEVDKLKNEIVSLQVQLANKKSIEAENQALHDQFNLGDDQPLSDPTKLLTAHIVAMPSFIPGMNLPLQIIIDRGMKDGLYVGQPVIVKNTMIGEVTKRNDHFSEVDLIINTSISFTAKTAGTGAIGIVRGAGDGMVFDNVLLSDNLKVNDLVITSGETQLNGAGVPPGVVIGKIFSVEKNSSNLFQKASIKPLVDFSRLSTVFVLLK